MSQDIPNKKFLQDLYTTAYESSYSNVLEVVDVWQDRPNTAVKIKANIVPIVYRGMKVEAFGFSKVAWPDEWDAAVGVDMAVRKAISKLAKTIASEIPDDYVG